MSKKPFLVTLAFFSYLAVLFVAARASAHQWLHGIWARGLTMALVALGLFPWRHWLGPRISRVLSIIGTAVLTLCYFLLLPFAAVSRLQGDWLRRRRPSGDSWWVSRKPIPSELEPARLEW